MGLPFLDRNLVCECGMSWAVMSGKAEVLTSQTTFGNNQVSRNGEGAFYVYHLLPTIGAEMTRDIINTVSWKGQSPNFCFTFVIVDPMVEREILTFRSSYRCFQ